MKTCFDFDISYVYEFAHINYIYNFNGNWYNLNKLYTKKGRFCNTQNKLYIF